VRGPWLPHCRLAALVLFQNKSGSMFRKEKIMANVIKRKKKEGAGEGGNYSA
jgi:hypothetical protein